ncbi:MAG: hypothetical protein HOU81_24700 [Hamadaea sp.]|uniref:hypothetical protein n=1 Tax=Hamadaea sp. TaxID=2024425 RepID=UPI00181FE1A9|nr:hypothetical protein [Hamadaea sp.]NUR74026.1 hypothetical protein [Hamadaea sp.]NUT17646.1 hypothetical protein [Hamadaea sp.]
MRLLRPRLVPLIGTVLGIILSSALVIAPPAKAYATTGSFQLTGNTTVAGSGLYRSTELGDRFSIWTTRENYADDHNVTIGVMRPDNSFQEIHLRGPNNGADLAVGNYQNNGYFSGSPVDPGLGIETSVARLPSWFTINRIDIAADHTVQAIDVTFVNYYASGLADFGRLVINYDPIAAQPAAVGAVSMGSGFYRSDIGNSVFAIASVDGIYAGGSASSTGGNGVKFSAGAGKTLGVGTYKLGDGSALGIPAMSSCFFGQSHEFTISQLSLAADGSVAKLDATYAATCEDRSVQGRVLIGFSDLPAVATATVMYRTAYVSTTKSGGSVVHFKGVVSCTAPTTIRISGGAQIDVSSTLSESHTFKTVVVAGCGPVEGLPWSATVSYTGKPVVGSAAHVWATYSLVDPFYLCTVGNEGPFSLVRLTATGPLPRR